MFIFSALFFIAIIFGVIDVFVIDISALLFDIGAKPALLNYQ